MSELAQALPYVIVLALLVSASAFFSGTEVAMFSLRRVDRQQMLGSEHRADALILRLLARPRRLIATLLIGNEVVNVSVSVVMAGLAPVVLAGFSELTMALVATAAALPLLLVFGEITPKTVAIKTSRTWARAAARPLRVFELAVTPLRLLVVFVANQILRPFGGSTLGAVPKDLSEGEFKALLDAGTAEGELDARERKLIHRVFEFGDKTVGQVMLPRDRIFALAYDLPSSRLVKEIAARGYSRVPIYEKSLDRIRGIVYAKDLVVQSVGLSPPRRLRDMLHEPLFVPRTIPIERLFRIFKHRKTHMALVVNEYGKLLGLVTMEDLLEELFGEIHDEREHQKSRGVRISAESTPAPPQGPAAESKKETQ